MFKNYKRNIVIGSFSVSQSQTSEERSWQFRGLNQAFTQAC